MKNGFDSRLVSLNSILFNNVDKLAGLARTTLSISWTGWMDGWVTLMASESVIIITHRFGGTGGLIT